ncbi:hypothetical protein [Novosphingobium sp.]|uniref:hypothetical protein n=1 Tax=Novosphingobium sp. TaxID=1874826 RepID=UPI0022C73B45|nr:hypothetical protein [Novosphingobium sp.]MCZ8018768.1 hypothetical protein [Novosphingobium sp.]MCZ8034773.1 hypothetical protein [Novosphingobium sp.]MCZ8052908.1 hypothetical protein [Novosphingobium sp.]MCZ8060666.1 hypothetical protein [Novosphingobium sp.]MCZ8230692.1 hypothetical protein [Novosphingobium sp.]
MVDYFALALSHGLLALAGWRLLFRDDLDGDPEPAAEREPDRAGDKPAAKPVRPGLRTRA